MTRRPGRVRGTLLSVWLPTVVLILWQTLASRHVLNSIFFPAPSAILAAGWRITQSGELGTQLAATLARMFVGTAIGITAGLACGLAMGAVDAVRKTLEPLVSALNATPKLVLLPMLLLVAGIGETARIVPVALTAFVILAVHGLDAVRGVDRAFVELARNYGANSNALLRRVYLPASLPQIFTGLRLALGRALVITVSVELIGAQNGLGSMIWMAWQTFSTEKLYVGVIVTGALGALFQNGLFHMEQRLIPWGHHARLEQAAPPA